MTIRFFFNNPGKAKLADSPYSIYVEFRYNGEHYKLKTDIKLKFKHFKSTTNLDQIVTASYQRDTKMSRVAKAKEFKDILKNIESVVDRHDKGFISGNDLPSAFEDAVRGKLPTESNLLTYFEKFYEHQQMKGNAAKTLANIKGTRSIIEEIIATFPDHTYNVFDLGIEFFDKFRKVCHKRGYEISTYNKYFKWMKSMMDWMVEEYPDARVNSYYRKEKELKTIEKEPITLYDEEIAALWNHKFSYYAHEQHRDMFIFQLLSGQRHSEMATLAKSLESIDEERRIWFAYSSKTVKAQKIPMTDVMMEIYWKYKMQGKFPVKSNKTRNQIIKKVFEMVGLDRKVMVVNMFLGSEKPEINHLPLYEAITTHVARASLITILSRDQVSHVIKQVSGHASEKEIKRYQGNDLEYLKNVLNEKSNKLFNK